MDMELYAELTDSIEYALDEADSAAKESKVRVIGQKVCVTNPNKLENL